MASGRFDRWIFESFEVSPQGLALYRILFALFALLVVAPGHDAYVDLLPLATLPDAMFAPPPGPMALFDGFPSKIAAFVIHFVLNLGLVSLLFGYRTRLASFSVGLLFLAVFGFSYSVGKINHTILFVLTPIVMSFSGWGSAYSYDALYRTPVQAASWPLTLLGLLVGFAMFTAGFAKILGGWLDPETHAAYGHVVKHFFVRQRTDLLASVAVKLRSGLVWEFADWGTVAFEIGFLAAVARARILRTFAAIAVLFHLAIMATLNISFVFNIIVYAAFVPWKDVADRVGAYLPWVSATMSLRFSLLGGILATALLAHGYGSPFLWLNEQIPMASDLKAHEVVVMILASLVVLLLGIHGAVAQLERLASTARQNQTT